MEAMKMQTTIYAPKEGAIREVAVKSGDSVKAGRLVGGNGVTTRDPDRHDSTYRLSSGEKARRAIA